MSQYKSENDKQVRQTDVLQPALLKVNPNAGKNLVTVASDNNVGSVDILVIMRGGDINNPNDGQPLFEDDGVTPLTISFANGLTQTFEAPGGISYVAAVPNVALGGSYLLLRDAGAQ